MPNAAGPMNQRVQFMRRKSGVYESFGDWQWAAYNFERPITIQNSGMQFAGSGGRLSVRNSLFAAGLRTSDRVEMDGEVYRITLVKIPLQDDDDLDIEIELAPTPDLYDREFEANGEIVTLRRIVANAAPIDVPVRAIVSGYKPEELNGGIQQGDRRLFLCAADVAASGFPVPIKSGGIDRLVVRDRLLSILAVDDNTHRNAGVLLAYDIQARGA